MITQAYTSKDTSINRVNAVYTKMEFKRGSKVLDYGGGKYDTNKDYMKTMGVTVDVFDPYNRDVEHNRKVYEKYRLLPPDYIVCSNVLNVIREADIIHSVLRNIIELLKGSNKSIVYIVVYEGDKSGIGKMSKKDCWQRNEKAADYEPLIKKYFKEVKRKGNIFICRL